MKDVAPLRATLLLNRLRDRQVFRFNAKSLAISPEVMFEMEKLQRPETKFKILCPNVRSAKDRIYGRRFATFVLGSSVELGVREKSTFRAHF